MPKRAAGILLYRLVDWNLEVLLAHPGGPIWAKKDLGVWSVPKGEYDDKEEPIQAAQREFREETGIDIAVDKAIQLTPIKQKSGKIVTAFAVEGDIDITKVKSNTFALEWPPKSKQIQNFPEIDRVEWFGVTEAREKIKHEQRALIDELEGKLRALQ